MNGKSTSRSVKSCESGEWRAANGANAQKLFAEDKSQEIRKSYYTSYIMRNDMALMQW